MKKTTPKQVTLKLLKTGGDEKFLETASQRQKTNITYREQGQDNQ